MSDLATYLVEKGTKLSLRNHPGGAETLRSLFVGEDPEQPLAPAFRDVVSVSLRNMRIGAPALDLLGRAFNTRLTKVYLRACNNLRDTDLVALIDACPNLTVLSVVGVPVGDKTIVHALDKLSLSELYAAGADLGLPTLEALATYSRGNRQELDFCGLTVELGDCSDTRLLELHAMIVKGWSNVSGTICVGRRVV